MREVGLLSGAGAIAVQLLFFKGYYRRILGRGVATLLQHVG